MDVIPTWNGRSKKFGVKNLWKCWGFVNIEFLDKNLTFKIVWASNGFLSHVVLHHDHNWTWINFILNLQRHQNFLLFKHKSKYTYGMYRKLSKHWWCGQNCQHYWPLVCSRKDQRKMDIKCDINLTKCGKMWHFVTNVTLCILCHI